MAVSMTKTAAPADIERVDISHIVGTVESLDATRARIAALKEEEAQQLALIRAAIGTARIGTVNGEDAIRLDERTNSHLDREGVKALLSDAAYASVLKMTPYVTVNLVGKFKRRGK